MPTSTKTLPDDISLCSGVGCELREHCVRFLTNRQLDNTDVAWWPLWFVDPEYDGKRCALFMPDNARQTGAEAGNSKLP